jgi:hypothetical protein
VAKAPPAFSRSGVTNLFGKVDSVSLKDFRLPAVVLERAKERAADAGLPLQEYLREMVTLGVMGREEVERMFARRLDAMTGKARE